MEGLINPENYEFAINALLPGFLLFYTFLSLQKAPLSGVTALFIASVILSFVYRIFLDIFLALELLPLVPVEVARLVNLVAIPIFIGGVWALSFNNIKTKLSEFGLHMRHPIPNAWDQAFANREGCWIIVHLSDGAKIRGTFLGRSLASSANSERDIYLEQTFEYTLYDGWVRPERQSSVLITPSAIQYIEFIECGEENE